MQMLIINEIVSHLKKTMTNLPLGIMSFFLFISQLGIFHAIKYILMQIIKIRKLVIYSVTSENIRNGALVSHVS